MDGVLEYWRGWGNDRDPRHAARQRVLTVTFAHHAARIQAETIEITWEWELTYV